MVEARKKSVFLVAGEASGDALGAGLMTALQVESPEIAFSGVGGVQMTQAGLSSLFPMEELSVMGLAEVLPRLAKLIRRINEVTDAIRASRPDAVITIDSPDFNFRVARKLRGEGIPIIHYVAPTVRAWRPGRAAKIARLVDHLLVLFPFEPSYFERVALPATFVGHPIVDGPAMSAEGGAFRRRHGFEPSEQLLAVLPGSRIGEITRHLPVFEETVQRLLAEGLEFQAVCVTLPHLTNMLRERFKTWPIPVTVSAEHGEKFDALAAADVALAASGTVALELAAVRTPSVIAYRMNPLTTWIAKRMIKVAFVNLVNLLLETGAVPEHLAENCRGDRIAASLRPLLIDAVAAERQRTAYAKAIEQLRNPGGVSPSTAAARVVLGVIEGNTGSRPT